MKQYSVLEQLRNLSVWQDGRCRAALFTNQTGYDGCTGEYTLQWLRRSAQLVRVFVPEHGLFAELQDQVGLDSTEQYGQLAPEVQFVSLYGSQETSLYMQPEWLADVDILLVDIQDVGSRYYTFATSVSYIFDSLATHERAPHVVVIERPNPAGAQVEGTVLTAEYQSFVGRPGLPHRHGLTLGELCRLYKQQAGAYKLELSIIHAPEYERQPELLFPDLLETGMRFNVRQCWEIAPSPNMPTPFTPLVYSGQCLLEGTNLSEGRGTTRPFEIWGAPYLRQSAAHFSPGNIPVKMSGARLRPLRFLPMFQKHAGQICFGFQIHLTGEPYHSLAHTLKLLRWLRESHTDFAWLEGVYEFVSDRPAIEILAGDPVLLAYLDGRESFRVVREKLEQAEHDWIQAARELRVYHRNMSRVALDPAEDFG